MLFQVTQGKKFPIVYILYTSPVIYAPSPLIYIFHLYFLQDAKATLKYNQSWQQGTQELVMIMPRSCIMGCMLSQKIESQPL